MLILSATISPLNRSKESSTHFQLLTLHPTSLRCLHGIHYRFNPTRLKSPRHSIAIRPIRSSFTNTTGSFVTGTTRTSTDRASSSRTSTSRRTTHSCVPTASHSGRDVGKALRRATVTRVGAGSTVAVGRAAVAAERSRTGIGAYRDCVVECLVRELWLGF